MDLSRRKFFGAAAVAPFAAKQAVSALQHEAKMQASTGGMLGGLNSIKDVAYGDPIAPLAAPQDWMQHEIKMLMARRKRVEVEPVPPPTIAIAAAIRIDGLRSVSGPVRSLMIAVDYCTGPRKRGQAFDLPGDPLEVTRMRAEVRAADLRFAEALMGDMA